MNDLQQNPGAVIRVWMKQVIEEQGMSCEAWAREAGVSPTTLTRFLADPNAKHVPSTKSIIKLAKVAGSQPNLLGALGLKREGSYAVPLVQLSDLWVNGEWSWRFAMAHSDETYTVLRVPDDRRSDLVAVACPSDSMVGEGIRKNDILLMDPIVDANIADGALVLGYVHDNAYHAGRVLGEFLTFSSMGMISHVPLNEVLIIGVILRSGRIY